MIGKIFRVEETTGRCAQFGKDLPGFITETVKEAGHFEKAVRVRCHGVKQLLNNPISSSQDTSVKEVADMQAKLTSIRETLPQPNKCVFL